MTPSDSIFKKPRYDPVIRLTRLICLLNAMDKNLRDY